MKKLFVLLLVLCTFPACAMAKGVTLRTVSSFAGTDVGAQAYIDILAEWEAETGNTVVDQSNSSDEIWKAHVLYDFAVGNEPDILFFFAATADSKPILHKVVPIREINRMYSTYMLEESAALREADGYTYAVPVRPFWEAMYVNVDLFEAYGLALPTDAEKLETAIRVFNENGIIPIAASLSDVPHYLVEMGILASGPVKDHQARPKTADEIPDSWVAGLELIKHLYSIGAFAEDAAYTTDELMVAKFRNKEAAMTLDGSWRANSIREDFWENTAVMPFPAYSDEADPNAIVGGISMGFYLTRKAWDNPDKRMQAVSLMAKLTSEESRQRLGFAFEGLLLSSSQAMLDNASQADAMSPPLQDSMDPDVRGYFFGMITAVLEGTMDPETLWRETISRGAFAD